MADIVDDGMDQQLVRLRGSGLRLHLVDEAADKPYAITKRDSALDSAHPAWDGHQYCCAGNDGNYETTPLIARHAPSMRDRKFALYHIRISPAAAIPSGTPPSGPHRGTVLKMTSIDLPAGQPLTASCRSSGACSRPASSAISWSSPLNCRGLWKALKALKTLGRGQRVARDDQYGGDSSQCRPSSLSDSFSLPCPPL